MTYARHEFAPATKRRINTGVLVLVAALALFVGARALWLHGFATGATVAECLDLWTLVGDDARNYDVCHEARRRFESDPVASAFAKEAELQLRREEAQ